MSFAFDSRENHQKVFSTLESSLSVGNIVFRQTDYLGTHGLAYRPNIRAWVTLSGKTAPLSEDIWSSTHHPDFRATAYTTTSNVYTRADNISGTALSPDITVRVYEEGEADSVQTYFDTGKRLERVLKTVSGSFTATSGGAYTTETVAHGLGDDVLPIMRWNDGTGWRDQCLINYDSGYSNFTNARPYVDGTNVYIEAINSYGTNKTIEYEVILIKKDFDDGVLFDSREVTLANFEEATTSQSLSGSWTSGQVKTYTLDIPHGEGDTLGSLYLTRSDVSSREYALPMAPLDLSLPSSGPSGFGLYINVENQPSNYQIYIRVNNPNAGTETLTAVDLDFRLALFVSTGD